jgi:hypothetical protein
MTELMADDHVPRRLVALEFEATVEDLVTTTALLPPGVGYDNHAGEREALTYMCLHGTDGLAFVTGDGGAIVGAVLLNLEDAVQSATPRTSFHAPLAPERLRRFQVRRLESRPETGCQHGQRQQ